METDELIKYLSLVGLWAIFYFTHSALASTKLKRFLEEKLPWLMKGYRLIYSVFSIIFFCYILLFSAGIKVFQLFPTSDLNTYLGYMLSAFGTIILVRAANAISMVGFLGLGSPRKEERLSTSGIYSRVRHPLYVGITMIFIGYLFVSPTLVSLTHLFCLILYIPFGIKFEEQNLIHIYGNSYRNYQSEVPAFFPKWQRKRG